MAVDVFTEAARRRNIRIIWVPWLNSTTQKALTSGKVDAWPAVSRTPEREKLFHFTPPWIESQYYLLTRQGSGISGAKPHGIRFAHAAYGRLNIIADTMFPGATPVRAPTHVRAVQTFCSGAADAVLLDARSLDSILITRPEGCGTVALHLELLPEASNPVSIASTPRAAAIADSLQKGIMELARDGGLWVPINKWSGFSAAQTRSFFALREVESRRDLYLFGLTLVTASLLGFGWAISRLRSAKKRAREAQLAAADSEARFIAFMDHSPLVGFMKDEQGRMIYVNRRYLETFQRKASECIGKSDIEMWPPETAAEFRRNDLKILASGESVEFLETTPVAGGEDITWLSLKFPFRQGSRTWLGGMCIDITERERAKEALRISEERFRSLFSHATVGIAIADADGCLLRVNSAFCRILSLSEGQCLEKRAQDLFCDRTQRDLLREWAEDGTTFETEHRRDGSTLWTENCVFAVRDSNGKTANVVIIVDDITQRKIAEAQLEHQAHHDLLTGLTNRRVHEAYLEDQIAKASRGCNKVCLLYVDLDDFKIVNDTLGHDSGDLVLREAAARLASLVADQHCLSRIGGDEFVLVQSVEDRQEAQVLSARLRLAMEQPFAIGGRRVELRASAGFSIFPDDGLDARTLRKKADDAMYTAKRAAKLCPYPPSEQHPAETLTALSALQ